jgi:hypothetical protein
MSGQATIYRATMLAIAVPGEVTGTVSARTVDGVGDGPACDVVVGGWIPATESRGTPTDCYAFWAPLGTGFTDADHRRVAARLNELSCAEPPFGPVPDDVVHARWVQPQLVAAVEYREFTTRLRHPSRKCERYTQFSFPSCLDDERAGTYLADDPLRLGRSGRCGDRPFLPRATGGALDELQDARQSHLHRKGQRRLVLWGHVHQQLGEPVAAVTPPFLQ